MTTTCRYCADTRPNGSGAFFWHAEKKDQEPFLLCEPCFDDVLARSFRRAVIYPFACVVGPVAIVAAVLFVRWIWP